MNIPEKISAFLTRVPDVSIGYNQIHFYRPHNILAGQTGFRTDQEGKSLISDTEGAWQEGWLVIGTDRLGDPVFIDLSSEEETIMIAASGDEQDNEWDPIYIADSLDSFEQIIQALHQLSAGRNDAVLIRTNPLTVPEKQAFHKMVAQQNPGSDIWFWEDFLE